MKNNQSLTGSCLCGQIDYQVTKIEPNLGHCHCIMCRKFHGSAFATYAEVKIENFKWVKGEDLLKSYFGYNGTERKFCSNCGSSLIFIPSNDKGEVVEFAMSTLDSEVENLPDAHIFTESKANWFKITDDLPQYLNKRD